MFRTTLPSILRRAACLVAGALLLATTACDPGFPSSEGEARIDEETFIQAFVDLRLTALTGALTESERDRILAEHGATEEDLREFIEVHGRNVPYMSRVWTEVDHRISEARDVDRMDPLGEGVLPGDEENPPSSGPR